MNEIRNILLIGDSFSGIDCVYEYLKNLNISALNCHNIINYDLTFEEDNDDCEKYLKDLANLFQQIQFGVDLILIFFSLSVRRVDTRYANQVVRLLGRECFRNLLTVITDIDNINYEYKESRLSNMKKELPDILSANLIEIMDSNIVAFDKNFKDFMLSKLEKIRPYKAKSCDLFIDNYNCTKNVNQTLYYMLNEKLEFANFILYNEKVLTYLVKQNMDYIKEKNDRIKNQKSNTNISKLNHGSLKYPTLILLFFGGVYYSYKYLIK
jgi:hypothetical protein